MHTKYIYRTGSSIT